MCLVFFIFKTELSLAEPWPTSKFEIKDFFAQSSSSYAKK